MSSKIKSLLRASAMRFSLRLSLLFVIMLTITGVLLSAILENEIRQEIDDELELTTLALQHEFEETETPASLWRDIDRLNFDTMLAVQLESGRILGPLRSEVFELEGFSTIAEEDLFAPDYLQAIFLEFWEFDEGFSGDFSEDLIAEADFTANWRVYVETFPAGKTAVFLPIDGTEDAIAIIPTILVPVGVILVITSLLGGAILGARQQRRLRLISDGLQRISDGVLDKPIRPDAQRDDIDDIMMQIDETADRLDISIRQMRDFSHNVAHELRTPITKLRAALDDGDAESEQRAIEHADRLIHIFDGLQRIARLKQKPAQGTLTTIEIDSVFALLDDLYSDVAEDRGQSLHFHSVAQPRINGDQALIVQALANLIENALNHAGTGAEIHVETTQTGLRVWDTGHGLDQAELSKMIEPFQHGQVSTGSGLGLALVHAIASYHSAELNISSRTQQVSGLDAQIEFKVP